MKNGNYIELKFQNGYVLKNFLYMPNKFKEIFVFYESDYYWLYYIYDKRDPEERPIYVGKTGDIKTRARQYYHRSSTDLYYSPTKGFPQRICDHIHENGIDNFKMVPFYTTTDPDIASYIEIGAIAINNTIDNGYNSSFLSIKHEKPIGTAESRRKLSKVCFILNPIDKIGYICTGFKLAGDIIGCTKNDIINAAKKASPRKNFFIYFLDYTRFEQSKELVKHKDCKRVSNDPRYVYSIAKSYEDIYKDFIKYAKYIKKYMKTGYNPEGFKIQFVTQVDQYDKGYIFLQPEEFLRIYAEDPLRIYNGDPKFIFD